MEPPICSSHNQRRMTEVEVEPSGRLGPSSGPKNAGELGHKMGETSGMEMKEVLLGASSHVHRGIVGWLTLVIYQRECVWGQVVHDYNDWVN